MKNKFFKKKSFWVLTILVVLLILGILSFRPIINPNLSDCERVTGVLQKYRYLDESQDVQMKLEGCDKVFYINHVFDEELDFADLDSLIGKPIVIYAVKHWTLLDPKSRFKHVARITNGGEVEVVYSEF